VLAAVLLRDASTATQVTGLAATRALGFGGVVLMMHPWLVRQVSGVSWSRIARAYAPAFLLGVTSMAAGLLIEAAARHWNWALLWQIAAIACVGIAAATVVVHKNRAALAGLRHTREPAVAGAA
jgi:hypothetical protein